MTSIAVVINIFVSLHLWHWWQIFAATLCMRVLKLCSKMYWECIGHRRQLIVAKQRRDTDKGRECLGIARLMQCSRSMKTFMAELWMAIPLTIMQCILSAKLFSNDFLCNYMFYNFINFLNRYVWYIYLFSIRLNDALVNHI